MTTKRWIAFFLGLIVICIGLIVWQHHTAHGDVVLIVQDGVTIYEIDLQKVRDPYTITISWNDHYNLIHVSPESIYVEEADCDNQVCVKHGPLLKNGSPISCLPNKLLIRWASSQTDI